MRAGGKNPFKRVVRKVFNVFLRGRLIEIFLAQSASKLRVAALFGEDGEVDVRGAQDLHHAPCNAARPAVVARGASDPIEHVVAFAFLGHRYVKVLRPVHPLIGVEPPGIPDARGIFKRSGGALREFAGLKREMTAHLDDEVGRLNFRRTGTGAGAAGRAGEEFLVRDDVAHELLPVGFALLHAVAELHHNRAGLERRPGANGRADIIASAAFHAGVKRCAVRPAKLRDGGKSEGLLLFNVVDLFEGAVGAGLSDCDPHGGSVEMRIESKGDRRNEGERGEAVHHPQNDVRGFKRRSAGAC